MPSGQAIAKYRRGPSSNGTKQEAVGAAVSPPDAIDTDPDPEPPLDPAVALDAAEAAERDGFEVGAVAVPAEGLVRAEPLSSFGDLAEEVAIRHMLAEQAVAAYDDAVRDLFKHPMYLDALDRHLQLSDTADGG
jgi:hypothetical protein